MQTELTYRLLIANLLQGIPFAFSRFGDGEFNCIFGRTGGNVDGHLYFSSLGDALRTVLLAKPEYYVGIQPFVRRQYEEATTARGVEFRRLTSAYPTNADLLHRASILNRLGLFFDALRQREVVLVGPRHLLCISLSTLSPLIRVEVPEKNCWIEYPRIFKECVGASAPKRVFLFCASMPAKVLIHNLYPQLVGQTLIDCGSLLDPYAGRCSRTYHKHVKA